MVEIKCSISIKKIIDLMISFSLNHQFFTAYDSFPQILCAGYPKAALVYLTSPMAYAVITGAGKACLDYILIQMKAAGDEKFTKIF